MSLEAMSSWVTNLENARYVQLDVTLVSLTWEGKMELARQILDSKLNQSSPAQFSTNEQLRLLAPIANRLGLYDAADYLRGLDV